MHEEFDQTTRDTGFDNGLNLVIRSIGEVGNCPAGVDQNFVVKGIDEFGKDWKGGSNLCSRMLVIVYLMEYVLATYRRPVRLWCLSTAEIAKRPRRISKHTQFATVTKQSQQWSECST